MSVSGERERVYVCASVRARVCVDQSHLISPQCLLTKPSCALSCSKCLFHLSLPLCLSVQGIQGPAGLPGEPGRDGLKVCLSNVLISCDANRLLLPPQPWCYSGLPSSSSPPPSHPPSQGNLRVLPSVCLEAPPPTASAPTPTVSEMPLVQERHWNKRVQKNICHLWSVRAANCTTRE